MVVVLLDFREKTCHWQYAVNFDLLLIYYTLTHFPPKRKAFPQAFVEKVNLIEAYWKILNKEKFWKYDTIVN